MTHAFLTTEWMAAVHEIRNKHQSGLPQVSQKIRLNQVISGAPFGDGTVKAFIDTSSGAIAVGLGELENPDATLMTDYATAKAILVDRDPSAAMQAFMSGRIKVQGDMTKLMALQTAVPVNDVSAIVDAEIKAITI